MESNDGVQLKNTTIIYTLFFFFRISFISNKMTKVHLKAGDLKHRNIPKLIL